MRKALAVVWIGLVLGGCVSSVRLRHPDTGDVVTCRGGLTRAGWAMLYGLAAFGDGAKENLTLAGQRGARGNALDNVTRTAGPPTDAAEVQRGCVTAAEVSGYVRVSE